MKENSPESGSSRTGEKKDAAFLSALQPTYASKSGGSSLDQFKLFLRTLKEEGVVGEIAEVFSEFIEYNKNLASQLVELKKSNTTLENQINELEEKAAQFSMISKYKSEFLANMSHELRTPLNSLLILSQKLSENEDGNLSKEQIKYAATVYSSGMDLLALINEILDLAKVEAGKMPVYPKEVEIFVVQDYLDHAFRPIAQHKGLEFSIEIEPGAPKLMITDVNRLQQILKNLLSNAFKFTNEGKITLQLRRADKGRRFTEDALKQAENVLAFSVSDTGIGIPKEKQQLIFEAFQQADGTTSRNYGGTGLGLTISREIARLLGGVVEVESSPGSGSTFTLLLPHEYAGTDVPAREPLAEPEVTPLKLPDHADFEGRQVLIVDDDMRNIFALTTVLEARKMTVLYAENGRAGLQVLNENPGVEMVLMDIMMPEMDGFEATQAIRRNPVFRQLPIISLTAKAMQGDRERCLAAGATDYITKPVNPGKLLSMMHYWFPRRGIETN